jgi:hypothetical protein
MALLLLLALVAGFDGTIAQASSREDMLRSVSANEKMIVRFQKELQSAPDGEKRHGLLAKIALLEQQNREFWSKLDPKAAASQAVPIAPASQTATGTKSMEDLTGEDWSRLSEPERQRFIYMAIGGLERQGVFIARPPLEYLGAMDKILRDEPALKQEYLDNLFVFCVYDGEPQTRDAISRIRKEAGQQEI